MLRSRSLLLACAVALLLWAPTSASALTIDFDTFSHGDVFADPERTAPDYSLIVDRRDAADGPGVIFDSNQMVTADQDLQYEGAWATGNIQNEDLGNLLIIQENNRACSPLVCDRPDDARRGGSFTFLLEEAYRIFEFVLVDIDLVENETMGSIRFFFREDGQPDIEVASFGFESFIGTQGIDFGERSANRIDLGDIGADFNGFEIDLGGSGGIDDIRLQQVPEPSTAGLLGVGLVALARARRLRRTRPVS